MRKDNKKLDRNELEKLSKTVSFLIVSQLLYLYLNIFFCIGTNRESNAFRSS